MDTKLFKAFTPFINHATDAVTLGVLNDALAEYDTRDPEGTEWRHMGFAEVSPNEFAIDVQGAATLCCVQLNERILPGAVQREKILERVASIAEREGRKVGKKEWAQVRDEVAQELLPKAFIRRKLIPIMFVGDNVLIFTTSAKVCDDVTALLMRAMCGDYSLLRLYTVDGLIKNDACGALQDLAKHDHVYLDNDSTLQTGDAIVLRGPNKQTIVIKDKDVASHDVAELLKQDYSVTKLAINYIAPGETDPAATFILNDKMVFSRFTVAGVTHAKEKTAADVYDAFLSTAWLTSQTARTVLDAIVDLMGGLTPVEPVKAAPGASTAVAGDDEL